MKELYVKLTSYMDVQKLTGLATQVSFRITVTDGYRTMNAKSFLCAFAMNLTKPLLLRLDCGDEDFEAFRRKAGQFEVK